MTYLTLLRYWYVVVILLLGFSLDHFRDEYLKSLKDIEVLEQKLELEKAEYQAKILKIESEHQKEIIEQQQSTFEVNSKILDVVNKFNINVDKHDERTKTVYKEIEKTIPITIRESCNFGSSWLSIANSHIQESNNSSTSNSK